MWPCVNETTRQVLIIMSNNMCRVPGYLRHASNRHPDSGQWARREREPAGDRPSPATARATQTATLPYYDNKIIDCRRIKYAKAMRSRGARTTELPYGGWWRGGPRFMWDNRHINICGRMLAIVFAAQIYCELWPHFLVSHDEIIMIVSIDKCVHFYLL